MIPDPADELTRAVCVIFVNFAGSATVEKMASRPWASVTFSGARHEFTLRLEGAGAAKAATAFRDRLEEHEFVLPGHVLADIAAVREVRDDVGKCVRLTLEALTVEDAC